MRMCRERILSTHSYLRGDCILTEMFLFIAAREVLPLWDKQIRSLCYQVNKIIEKIGATEPAWMAKLMDEQMAQ